MIRYELQNYMCFYCTKNYPLVLVDIFPVYHPCLHKMISIIMMMTYLYGSLVSELRVNCFPRAIYAPTVRLANNNFLFGKGTQTARSLHHNCCCI